MSLEKKLFFLNRGLIVRLEPIQRALQRRQIARKCVSALAYSSSQWSARLPRRRAARRCRCRCRGPNSRAPYSARSTQAATQCTAVSTLRQALQRKWQAKYHSPIVVI